jgi:hypothetical protein
MPIPIEQKIAIEDRRAQVLQLRLKGLTWDDIAAQVGVTRQTAYSDYTTSLKRQMDNAPRIAGQVKAQNEARLLGIIEQQTLLAQKNPDSKAYDRMMRAIDMLNKMYGVYGIDQSTQQASTQQGLTIRYEQTNITVQRDTAQHSRDPVEGTQYVLGSAQPTLHSGSANEVDSTDDYSTME